VKPSCWCSGLCSRAEPRLPLSHERQPAAWQLVYTENTNHSWGPTTSLSRDGCVISALVLQGSVLAWPMLSVASTSTKVYCTWVGNLSITPLQILTAGNPQQPINAGEPLHMLRVIAAARAVSHARQATLLIMHVAQSHYRTGC
jgi:hypothetical protein